jgi:hypothetical protein
MFHPMCPDIVIVAPLKWYDYGILGSKVIQMLSTSFLVGISIPVDLLLSSSMHDMMQATK